MRKLSSLVGARILSQKKNNPKNRIKDIRIDISLSKIVAYETDVGNIFDNHSTIDIRNITAHGERAVVVEETATSSEAFLENVEQFLRFRDDIKDMEVLTRCGNFAGTIKDLLFDEGSGRIEGAVVSNGLFEDLFQGRKILPFLGRIALVEECIVIDKEAREEMLEIRK